MRNRDSFGIVLGGALFVVAAASAQDKITAPPWGEDGGPKIVFGDQGQGVAQFDYKAGFRMTARDNGSGPDGTDSTTDFGFWRNRVALRGGWGEKFSLYVQADFNTEQGITPVNVVATSTGFNVQLLDAVARFNLADSFKINVGKFKYNLSRENLEACEEPLSLDRSLFIRPSFVATRDVGVGIWGNLLKDRVQYRLDAMQGRQATAGEVVPGTSFRYSGRAHVTLLDPENGYGYKGTYLGKKKVLTFGGAYQFEPNVAYTDTVNRLDPTDYKAWTGDVFFEYPFEHAGMITASGAYEKIDLGGAYKGAHPDPAVLGTNGEKNGWYGKVGYLIPQTKLQLFGRYEKWRFASLNGVYDELMDWAGGGASYYIWGQSLKLTGEFSHSRFDKHSYQDFNTFVTQLQVMF